MKKGNWLLAGLCLVMFMAKAQTTPTLYFRYYGGPNYIKMIWPPESWPESVMGINVKRQMDSSEWVLLNASPIIPASDSRDDLAYVTTSQKYLKALQSKYDSLIKNNSIPSKTFDQMYTDLLSDPEKIKILKFLVSIQFDYALIHGIGFYDTDIPPAKSYTYALYTVDREGNESAVPVETFTWNYGEQRHYKPKALDTKIDGSFNDQSINIQWKLETEPLKENEIIGFLLYTIDAKGNRVLQSTTPTRVNMRESETTLIMFNKNLDRSKKWNFEAVPVDAFEEKGEPLRASYVPK